MLSFIKIFRDGLWPGGKLKPPTPPRTLDEKLRTRDEANRKLSSLVPGMLMYLSIMQSLTFISDLAANMIGRSNARRGARRMFAVLQNRRLNQHIAYTVVDEVRNLPWLSHATLIFSNMVRSLQHCFLSPAPIPNMPHCTSFDRTFCFHSYPFKFIVHPHLHLTLSYHLDFLPYYHSLMN